MSKSAQKVGETSSGEAIAFKNLRDISTKRMARYAKELVSVAKDMSSKEHYEIDSPLFGYARSRDLLQRMIEIDASGSTQCSVVTINDALAGVAMKDYMDAGSTPLPIARPRKWSNKIDYWLIPDYYNDAEANTTVADVLVHNNDSKWQWTLLNPHYDEPKIATYAQLGLTAVVQSTEWIETLSKGPIVLGAELWAKPPHDDSRALSRTMIDLNNLIKDEYAVADNADITMRP